MIVVLSLLLMLLGICGLVVAGAAFGDIGLAAGIGGGAALLSGIAIMLISRQITTLKKSEG